MKVWLLRFVILALIVFQLLRAMVFPNYSFPRGSEWGKAYSAYQANPSPENREELLKQGRLNGQHNKMHEGVVDALLLVADFGIVFYFLRDWTTKKHLKAGRSP